MVPPATCPPRRLAARLARLARHPGTPAPRHPGRRDGGTVGSAGLC